MKKLLFLFICGLFLSFLLSVNTFASTLPAPTGFKASVGTDSITLQWEPVEGADAYKVWQYDTTLKKYVQIKYITGISCEIENLLPSTSYRFVVTSYDKIDGKYVKQKDSKAQIVKTESTTKNIGKDTKIYKPIDDSDVFVYSWAGRKNTKVYKDYSCTNGGGFSYCIHEDTGKNVITITKSFTGKPNTLYIISADIKTEGVENHENKIDPMGAGISIGDYKVSNTILGTNDWQTTYYYAMSDSSGKISVSMTLGHWYNACSGTAWFDNLKCIPASELHDDNSEYRFLAVVLANTSYSDDKTGFNSSHAMKKNELDNLKKTLKQMGDDITEMTDGKISATVDIAIINDKFSSYKDDWLGPRIFENDAYGFCVDNNIDVSEYDHIFFISCLPNLPVQYYGLGGTCISGKIGMSQIIFTSSEMLVQLMNPNAGWTPAVYVHEWIHSIEYWANELGYDDVVGADGGESSGYRGDDDWKQFYTDVLNKKVFIDGKYKGLSPDMLNLRPRLFS